MRINLKPYLEDIRDAYYRYRSEYTNMQNELTAMTEKHNAALADAKLSAAGKQEVRHKFNTESYALKTKIENLGLAAEKDFAAIRQRVDDAFGAIFRATPEKLDTNALELLRADILTDKEIKSLAGKYADNCTMRRLIGKFAAERASKDPSNHEMRILATTLSQVTQPHLEPVDALIMWSQKGLRMDRVLSDGIAKSYDAHTTAILEQYGEISYGE